MGNRGRLDQFDWTLGAQRRLRRYLREADLSYTEAAALMGLTRGAIAGAADRYGLAMTVEQRKDRQSRHNYERNPRKEGRAETWKERKARRRPQKIAAE